ncbi:hypothetical protein ACJMK2_027781 [Sinanodonta woodiana]|uniref:C-type lectin domain-containing protein n=1 Tax=Sinanodonta woodiana TaxID=1069815 RepID=A0ABD3X4Y8_SINWO
MKSWSITRTLLYCVQFFQVASWCNNTDAFLLNGWKQFDGALYMQFGNLSMNHTDWEMYCQSYGGSLTTAKTAEENDFVYSIMT